MTSMMLKWNACFSSRMGRHRSTMRLSRKQNPRLQLLFSNACFPPTIHRLYRSLGEFTVLFPFACRSGPTIDLSQASETGGFSCCVREKSKQWSQVSLSPPDTLRLAQLPPKAVKLLEYKLLGMLGHVEHVLYCAHSLQVRYQKNDTSHICGHIYQVK